MLSNSDKLVVCDAHHSLLCSRGTALASSFSYSAFGWRRPTMQAPVLGFDGQRVEPLTGWYCLGHGHRTYDAVLMRFQSPDQLSPFDAGGVNAYVYCLADPINHEDPTGKYSALIAQMLRYLAMATGHVGNIATGIFRPRPRGLLGYARAATDIGYGGIAIGFTMQSAGYKATGMVASNIGFSLVSIGKSIRTAHGAFEAVSESRIGQALRRRMQSGSAVSDPLVGVVVDRTSGSATHTSPASSSIYSSVHIESSDVYPNANRKIRDPRAGLRDQK